MSGEEETRRRERWRRIGAVLDAIFDAPAEQRERILAEQCAGDASLRAEIEALLAAEARPDRRLDSPAGVWADGLLPEENEPAPAHVAGDRIGPYRLVRELGRGGMGTVWLAERADGQFEQQVALKLLKRGLDSDAILARFLEERRILARLRHPHIAQLLDGGIADDGRPYYVMEHIDGALITAWCDQRRLGVRKRLLLFLDTVEAVQYAHQQLIIHRDLKPGNVMVSSAGEVKLLDFGIAKVLDAGRDSAEAATLTRLGWRMLTPEYAAPEQLRGDPATTGTDVYALGVLLHELLAGCRPAPAAERATESGKPPPRPSTRVTAEAATARGGSAERLRRRLRGDLDTIILKALQPEPERRYGSAQALADDLRRYLNGAPVRARPDSAWYRARRFVSRHRWGTAAAALIVLSLAGGVLATGWQAREAQRQAREAQRQAFEANKQARRAEEAKDFLVEIFEAGTPEEWQGKEVTARELLEIGAKRIDEELAREPELRAEMQALVAELLIPLGDLDQAEKLLRSSLDARRRLFGENHEAYAQSLYVWAYLLYSRNDTAGSDRAITRAVAIYRRRLGDHRETAAALGGLSNVRQIQGRMDEAIRLREQALAIDRRVLGNMHDAVAHDLSELGLMLVLERRHAEARPLLAESLRIRKKLYGVESVKYATSLNANARLFDSSGELVRAAAAHGAAADIYRKADAPELLATAASNHGGILCALGRFAEGERSLREALALRRRSSTPAGLGSTLNGLGHCKMRAGLPTRAEPFFRETLATIQPSIGPDHPYILIVSANLAHVLVQQGRVAEAMSVLAPARDRLLSKAGRNDARLATSALVLARLLFASGDRERSLDLARDALQTLRTQGDRRTDTTAAAIQLAEMELQNDDPRRTEARLREIEPTLRVPDLELQDVEARMLRGAALARLGRAAEGEALLRSALSDRRRIFGDDNPRTGEARLQLGIALLRQDKREEGRRLIERGRAEFTREFGGRHDVVRRADEALAARS